MDGRYHHRRRHRHHHHQQHRFAFVFFGAQVRVTLTHQA